MILHFLHQQRYRGDVKKIKELPLLLSNPHPVSAFLLLTEMKSQAWMNPAETPRGTGAELGPSQCHTAVQSLERRQISHCAAVQLPPEEPHTLQQCTLQQCLLCDSKSLSSLPSTSTVTCCSHGAQMLSSISACLACFTCSRRSVPGKALYLLSVFVLV